MSCESINKERRTRGISWRGLFLTGGWLVLLSLQEVLCVDSAYVCPQVAVLSGAVGTPGARVGFLASVDTQVFLEIFLLAG